MCISQSTGRIAVSCAAHAPRAKMLTAYRIRNAALHARYLTAED